jgi:hypothetical protein
VDAAFDTGGNWNAKGTLTDKQQESVKEVLDKSINLWLSNERKEDFDQVHIAKSKERRGSYRGGNIVIPTSGKGELDGSQLRTLVHEYAHHVEKQDPEVMKRTIAFRDARRKEDGGINGSIEKLRTLEKSKAYESHEVSYRDKWQERGWGTTYPGRIYSHDATEILTMGAERLYQDPFDFMTKDPEAFQLVVSIFRGVPEE